MLIFDSQHSCKQTGPDTPHGKYLLIYKPICKKLCLGTLIYVVGPVIMPTSWAVAK